MTRVVEVVPTVWVLLHVNVGDIDSAMVSVVTCELTCVSAIGC